MAQKPAQKAAPKPAKSGGIGMRVGLILMLGLMMIFSMPTVILLAVAMLPTLVALLVDRTPDKLSGIAVGGFNLAGTAPFVIDMWFGSGSSDISVALDILSNVLSMMVIYGTAALGWAIFFSTPTVIGTYMVLTANQRLTKLRNQQRKLIETWGREVTEVAEHEEV